MSARRAALAILDATLTGRATLDRAFDRAAGQYRLEGPDRAFARALSTTALRRLGEMDAAVKPFLKRPLPKKALTAQNILRLGAAQILLMGVPAHAAVGETTGLATGRAESYRGLVNAVLRRLAAEGAPEPEPDAAARMNTPGWLWESWRGAYGLATTRAIAAAHMAEPPLDFTLFQGDAAGWSAPLEAAPLPTAGLRRAGSARVPELPGYGDGAWAPQDAAAALPARLLGDVAGKTVIDLCAAPGGKTAQLAAAGAEVIAVDLSETRMARLEENLERLKLSARTVVADAGEWRPDAPVDAVLLDAPCSATGTIRRHPDAAWSRAPADVRALTPIQNDLLEAAAEMIRPGGLLVYACCSLQPEEGPVQTGRFLKRRSDFERAPITPGEIQGLPDEAIDNLGDLRTLPSMWPEIGGMDGFFASRMIKT